MTIDTIERPAAEQRETIGRAYRYHRRPRFYGGSAWRKSYIKQTTAVDAFILARSDLAAGRRRYPAPIYPAAGAATADPTRWRDALRDLRWMTAESPDVLPFRNVGTAESIADLRHSGWFTDEFQDETVFGIVLQCTSRNGRVRFVPAIQHSCNNGIAFDSADIYAADRSDESDIESAKRDCARTADRLAEIYAEREREYQEQSQARFEFDELSERNDEIARELDDIGREMVAAEYLPEYRTIRDTVERRVQDLERESESNCKRMTELREAFDGSAGWNE